MIEKFKGELECIKEKDIFDLAVKCLKNCDDYFFTMPASTTGKYHPLFSLGEGGLVRHTRAVVYFLGELYRSQLFDISTHQYYLLVLGAIVHDIKKAGDNSTGYTVKEHPTLAVEFIKRMNEGNEYISAEDTAYVCDAVHSHMGVWGEKDGLPVPRTEAQKILHLADLLASRKELDIKYISEGVENIERTPIFEEKVNNDPNTFTMPFGKYRGKTFAEIEALGGDYLNWAVNNLTNSPDIVELMKQYLKNK